MKGNAKVIVALTEALSEELMAINQYFIHSEMCENWGYEELSKYLRKLAIVEMKHAEKLIERILFLDGAPSLLGPKELNVGKNVKEQLQNDLELELGAVKMYNDFVKLSREIGDNASSELLRDILEDEEDHVDWLEAQLGMIQEITYEQYLSRQMKKD
jgi:bacterioferritin